MTPPTIAPVLVEDFAAVDVAGALEELEGLSDDLEAMLRALRIPVTELLSVGV
jgi:hypothetical protein